LPFFRNYIPCSFSDILLCENLCIYFQCFSFFCCFFCKLVCKFVSFNSSMVWCPIETDDYSLLFEIILIYRWLVFRQSWTLWICSNYFPQRRRNRTEKSSFQQRLHSSCRNNCNINCT
jgi:hypothetical protein